LADDESTAVESDLGVRTLSAIVMLVVAGVALWLGGIVWTVLVAAVGFGVIWEFGQLVQKADKPPLDRAAWALFALVYVGLSALTLIWLRWIPDGGLWFALLVIGLVVATDIGAYFAGRLIGGPKLAPHISPSKTWAGLAGGVVLAALFAGAVLHFELADLPFVQAYEWKFIGLAAGLAVVAQLGDLLESRHKRKAGVKDSGNLIPGHGGLFDRVDGLLAVLFVLGLSLLYLKLRGA
jgi:phosphatidate cytidylyltransferase